MKVKITKIYHKVYNIEANAEGMDAFGFKTLRRRDIGHLKKR
jgi:hypothetical protein